MVGFKKEDIEMLDGTNITYEWEKDNIFYLDGVNMTLSSISDLSDTYTVTDVNISDAGMYTCNVSLSGGGEYVKHPPESSTTSQIFVLSKCFS